MPVIVRDLNISIKNINDVLRCLSLASMLEVAGWPKPGNVHRTKNFNKTKFEHFLAGIAAIQPSFEKFCKRISQYSFIENSDYESIELGQFFKEAVEEMMKWQRGGNVLLGHILILAPLVAAVVICLNKNQLGFGDFKFFLNKLIAGATVKDTINLYEAIRLCNPGGLGKIDKYDINDDISFDQIKNEKVTLKRIFELSRQYDLISLEYSTGFQIILSEGLPFFIETFNKYCDINIATVNSYLYILSRHPDTLIIRKSGLDSALYVSDSAMNILRYKGIASKKGLKFTFDLDKKLQENKGRMNPGTTADLIAGVIFCSLIFGLRF